MSEKTRVERTEKIELNESQRVRVQFNNKVVDVAYTRRRVKPPVVKLSADEYLTRDGEIHKYRKTEHRGQNFESLRKTFRNLRGLVNKNFEGVNGEFHLILTYAENMTDLERLYSDFKRFWQKIRRLYPRAEYIVAVEPQERGAWHCHMLLKTNGESTYIVNKKIAEMWGNGFTKIKSLKGVTNIGAYLSAYLTDMETSEGEKERMIEGKGKKFKKGERLKLYPPGMNIYRRSRGIETPETMEITVGELKKIVGHNEPHYSITYKIVNKETKEVLNVIQREQYNLDENHKTIISEINKQVNREITEVYEVYGRKMNYEQPKRCEICGELANKIYNFYDEFVCVKCFND